MSVHEAVSDVLKWWREANKARKDLVDLKDGKALADILRITFKEAFDECESNPPAPLTRKNPHYDLPLPCAFAITLENQPNTQEELILVVLAQNLRKVDTVTIRIRKAPTRALPELCGALGVRYETGDPRETSSAKQGRHKYAHAQLTPAIRLKVARGDGDEHLEVPNEVMHRALCGCSQPEEPTCDFRQLRRYSSTPALPVRLAEHVLLAADGDEAIFRQLLAAALLASLGCDCESGDDGLDGCACCGGIPGAKSVA